MTIPGESPQTPSVGDGILRFDDLQKSYNYLHPAGRLGLFVGMTLGEIASRPRPVRALDIGCGTGIALDVAAQQRIAANVEELWGVEPDPHIAAPPWFTNFQTAMMETAKLPESSIDIAYSCLVMEHVTKPREFMAAVYRCLKPGGVYFFMTINARHYFARITRTVRAVRLDEFLLRVVRPKEQVDEYHYPVAYKFNSERTIDRVCTDIGFEPPRYVYAEPSGPEPYFPGPLRPIYLLLHGKRRHIQNPKALLELYCLVRKPG
jgi:SAM-dependent methyltransferase